MTSVPPELAGRVGALAKNLDMNMDAIALLTRKAEAMRETLRLQSVITAENGVSQRYQERIDELAGQASSVHWEQQIQRGSKRCLGAAPCSLCVGLSPHAPSCGCYACVR
jgi:hypothetical protein